MKKLAAVLSLAIFLHGCGTYMYGSNQDLMVSTNPGQARIKFSNGSEYKTPSTVTLERKNDYTATVEKEGYEPQTVEIKGEFNFVASFLGNLIIPIPGALIVGIIMDVSSGGAFTLMPEEISLSLKQKPAPPAAPAGEQPAAVPAVTAPAPAQEKKPDTAPATAQPQEKKNDAPAAVDKKE